MSLISSLLMGLAILSIALIPLETLWPGVARQRRFRHGWLLDVVYWFFTALITKPISKVAVLLALLPLLLLTSSGSFANLLKGHGPLGSSITTRSIRADDHSHRFYRLLVAPRVPWKATMGVSRDSPQFGGAGLAFCGAGPSGERYRE
jgi:hypothetical protein